MTQQHIEIVHGSPFALRFDGSGHCPVDNTFAEEWVTVLKLVGEDYMPMRRYPDQQSALDYISLQLKAVRERREDERN